MGKSTFNFKERLSRRIGVNDIYEIIYLTQENDKCKQELYQLLFDDDETTAYQAAWVFNHFSLYENKWLYDKQEELIDGTIACQHSGRKRLLLSLLYRQPLHNPPRTDFLDFCLERMVAKNEPPAIQTLCMKLAYELCRPIPELLQEFRAIMEMVEFELFAISMRTARKNVLKAMQKGKSLQIYLM